MTALFTTDPHGSQSLFLTEAGPGDRIANQLFTVKDDQGREIVMTGEELNSFASQWQKYVKRHQNV